MGCVVPGYVTLFKVPQRTHQTAMSFCVPTITGHHLITLSTGITVISFVLLGTSS